jgi:hypothetical protein
LLNARFRGRMPGSADAVLAPSDGSVLVWEMRTLLLGQGARVD